MVKVFKSHNQQLKILRRKSLQVPSGKPKRVLEKEGFFQVINGYKDLFLSSRKTTTTPEVFTNGAHFSEIEALYNFDFELKMIMLKRVLKIENQLKNRISYHFSNQYGHDNYLKTSNFDSSTQTKLADVMKLIKDLQSDIAKDIGKKPAITHYMTTHGYVPLWVLMPFLTFGRVGHFYKHMLQPDRQAISRIYGISDADLGTMIHVLTLIRNCCAHDDRLYSFRSKQHLRTNRYHSSPVLGIPFTSGVPSNGRNDLFAVLIIFKYFFEKREIVKLVTEIKKITHDLRGSLNTITINDVFTMMGFPINWELIKDI